MPRCSTPRRPINASSPTNHNEMSSAWGSRVKNAEVTAAPIATDAVAVRIWSTNTALAATTAALRPSLAALTSPAPSRSQRRARSASTRRPPPPVTRPPAAPSRESGSPAPSHLSSTCPQSCPCRGRSTTTSQNWAPAAPGFRQHRVVRALTSQRMPPWHSLHPPRHPTTQRQDQRHMVDLDAALTPHATILMTS
jgi:hypothetical protein